MNKMTEKEIHLIKDEDYQDAESSIKKVIFDNNIFEQIKGKELDLSIDKVLEIPIVRNWFKRQKEEYYVISQQEHLIDSMYAQGKAIIPIINKRQINNEIQNLKTKSPLKYVHLGGIEILIKACFREGIDTPIEMYLADDRIIEPIEKSVIAAVKGNLIYQKFKFIVSANYSVALTDTNIDKALVLYWKMSGVKLDKGSKIFTARCKNLYILTTKHKINAKNKINKISIENPFDNILTVIDNNDYSYYDFNNPELEIIQDRLSRNNSRRNNSKRIYQESNPSSSRMSTSSRRISYPREQEERLEIIKSNHYFITGVMDQRKYLILVNTGQEDNYIIRELIHEKEIIVNEQRCPDLPSILSNIEETTEKELIIGGIPILIKFKIHPDENIITLGIKWLETLKPYSLEDKQLIITYQNKKIVIKRTII